MEMVVWRRDEELWRWIKLQDGAPASKRPRGLLSSDLVLPPLFGLLSSVPSPNPYSMHTRHHLLLHNGTFEARQREVGQESDI